jgi:hypothetical protein
MNWSDEILANANRTRAFYVYEPQWPLLCDFMDQHFEQDSVAFIHMDAFPTYDKDKLTEVYQRRLIFKNESDYSLFLMLTDGFEHVLVNGKTIVSKPINWDNL